MARKPIVRETVSLYEAKTQLSRLVDQAAAGEEIVISKSGRPRARLVPLEDTRVLRVSGRGRGQWRLRKHFDAELPDEATFAYRTQQVPDLTLPANRSPKRQIPA